MAYYNPYITWVVSHPLYTNQGFLIAQFTWSTIEAKEFSKATPSSLLT